MPRASSHSLARLPQVAETWLIATTQLRLWLTPPGAAPHRPYLIFIVSMDTGMIRGHDLVDSEPAPGDVRKALVQAMQSPPPGLGEPCRPKGVAVAVAAQAEALAQFFAAGRVEIDVFEAPVPDEVWQIVRELEEHMRGGPEHPGYLSLKGVTPELAGGFYTAAADYYRAAPWVRLSNYQVLALRHPAERAYRYIIVMGQGGIEYGLAVYRRWQDVERMFTDDEPPIRMMPAGGVHSFSFETIDKVPFDDLEAQQRHGWEVAAANAYPLAFIIDKGGVVRRPSAADLRWYEAALRAIPRLVRDDLKADGRGDYLPLETTLTVPTHAGEIEVAVKYPAGKLQLA